MKKILFIDRDGTIIVEPPTDMQVDSLEKLSFLPKAISSLRKIAEESDFEFVMVTNQDGLGTDSFPEETFWLPHNKMMEILTGENIHFSAIHIDRTFEHENAPTRKPKTGMLEKYFDKTEYDLKNSFVLGDRLTDVQLAINLGSKAIYLGKKPFEDQEQASATAFISDDWDDIYEFLRLPERKVSVERITKETKIWIELNLDGKGKSKIETGLGFFDHMLDQLAKHSGADLNVKVEGDLHIDEHHTIEDTGIALGEAYLKALGDKKGIARYGFNILPMDEALVHAAIDFSGRNWIVWDAKFSREKIGEMPTEMFFHFFKSFTDAAKCNLNIKAEADNEHHKIEAIFKAFAKAVKMATKREIKDLDILPSTKGIL